MADKTWEAVDQYFLDTIIGQDVTLEHAQKDAEAAGLPPISVTAALGKLLHLLVRLHGARKVLEVGTLAGYSTIWMARALKLTQDIQRRFYSEDLGVFYQSEQPVNDLPVRPLDFQDAATPTGASLATALFARLGLLLENAEFRNLAGTSLATVAAQLGDTATPAPSFFRAGSCFLSAPCRWNAISRALRSSGVFTGLTRKPEGRVCMARSIVASSAWAVR